MYKLRTLFFIIALGLAGSAWSVYPQTPDESRLCKSMGVENHECDCIRYTNKAVATLHSNPNYGSYQAEALLACNYHLSPGPDFYFHGWSAIANFQIGRIMRLNNKSAEAASSFSKALQLNQKYVEAYAELANVFMDLKNRGHALDTVSEGLRWVPGSHLLQRKYLSLGGKLPYPTPYAAPTIPAIPEKDAASVKQVATVSKDSTAAPDASLQHTVIGQPGDPWCRFCPDTLPAPAALTPATPGVIAPH